MPPSTKSTEAPTSPHAIRAAWLEQLEALVLRVDEWARAADWSTRRIEKRIEDSVIGDYLAPGLLMQFEATRLILDPIGQSGNGDGIVDLYLMPQYDDVAMLRSRDGEWEIRRRDSDDWAVAAVPLTRESLQSVIAEMHRNGSSL
jgi:hypothetical protein